MTLTVVPHDHLDDDLTCQLVTLYETSPEFADGESAVAALRAALDHGDRVYTANFNGKAIAAIWRRHTESPDTRLLQYIVVHPANRGRGIAEEMVERLTQTEETDGAVHFQAGCGAIHRILEHLGKLG